MKPSTHLFDSVEKKLKKTLVILLTALFIAQCCLQVPSIRMFISPTDQLEGVPLDDDGLADER